MIEPYEKLHRQTSSGTEYEIWKWICPVCKQKKSTLYVDNEWCHGDAQGATFKDGIKVFEGCTECWIAIKVRDDETKT